MTWKLRRYYGQGSLHFITFSCYRRRPLLAPPARRDGFLRTLEEVRRQMRFVVLGYVVMPEHVHLLISEPELGDPSGVVQLLKQKTSHSFGRPRRRADERQSTLWPEEDLAEPFWQRRFYDFNVFTQKKRAEKTRYMHNNPVRRGLAPTPADWKWSSYRWYAFGEEGRVKLMMTVFEEVKTPTLRSAQGRAPRDGGYAGIRIAESRK